MKPGRRSRPGSQARASIIREEIVRSDYRALYGAEPPRDFMDFYGEELYRQFVRDGSMRTWEELAHKDLAEAGLL